MNDKYFLLIKNLLLHPYFCPPEDNLPENKNQWVDFVNLLIKNRLTAYLYHFHTCTNCQSYIPKSTLDFISNSYYWGLAISLNYKKLRESIAKILNCDQIPAVLLKDNDYDQLSRFYPDFYYPLKFDLDLWGRKEDIKKIKEILTKLDYQGNQIKYKNQLLEQYEFTVSQKKPQTGNLPNITALGIEIRFQIISAPVFKNSFRNKLNIYFWERKILTKKKLGELDINDAFFVRILIFFFDDRSQGMKNLYDLWSIANYHALNWAYLFHLAEKLELTDFFVFTVSMTCQIFGKQKGLPKEIVNPSFSVKLARIIFGDYQLIYKPLYSHHHLDRNVAIKEKYLYSLATTVLFHISLFHKFRLVTIFSFKYFLDLTYSIFYKSLINQIRPKKF